MAKLSVVGKAHESGSSGDFHWFIYASSLDAAAFAQWAEQHGYALPDLSRGVVARLAGFRLSFDVESRFWGGAVASLTEAPGQFVEGIALPLPGTARGLVDHKEGAISGLYSAFDCDVEPVAGGAKLAAIAYRASPHRRLASEAAPSSGFLDALIRGARQVGLSEDYIAGLEARKAGARER